jgi:lysozyme
MNAAGLALLKSFESCVLYAYDDANDKRIMPGDPVVGTLTIGWGETHNVRPGETCTQEQADAWLAQELEDVCATVQSLIEIDLTPNQFSALVDFEYNTGALSSTPGLALINQRQFQVAWDNHLCLYNEDENGVNQGLVRRRAAERALFFEGGS